MARFFRFPRNYVGTRSYSTATPPAFLPQVQDNDYKTETDVLTIDVYIDTVGDGTGDATAFTALFIKCVDVASYSVTLTDGNISDYSVTIDDTLPNGRSIIDLDGYQNHLYLYDQTQTPDKVTAKVVQLTFTGKTGGTPAINEIMVLEELFTIDEGPETDYDKRFRSIQYNAIDRGASLLTGATGEIYIISTLNNPRQKNRVDYTTRFKSDTDLERLLHFKANHKEFAFAPDYNLYPRLVFPAVFPQNTAPIRYDTTWKLGSRSVNFVVDEK